MLVWIRIYYVDGEYNDGAIALGTYFANSTSAKAIEPLHQPIPY